MTHTLEDQQGRAVGHCRGSGRTNLLAFFYMIVSSINPIGHGLNRLGDSPNIYSFCFLTLYLQLDDSGLFTPFLAGLGGPAVLTKKGLSS